MMKLSNYVIDFLVKEGVTHVFELIGGAITHLLDSVYNRDDMQCISVHHEQSAAFAAEAYARINGNLGVAMATSGPGALNLVTGIGSCYFDSVPCLFITGQGEIAVTVSINADHAEKGRMVMGYGIKSHQRSYHRYSGFFYQ